MKLEQMKTVLEKGGKFEGINRKVQIKPIKWIEQADGAPEVPSDSAARMRGLFHFFFMRGAFIESPVQASGLACTCDGRRA
jgi:hypothetical protein